MTGPDRGCHRVGHAPVHPLRRRPSMPGGRLRAAPPAGSRSSSAPVHPRRRWRRIERSGARPRRSRPDLARVHLFVPGAVGGGDGHRHPRADPRRIALSFRVHPNRIDPRRASSRPGRLRVHPARHLPPRRCRRASSAAEAAASGRRRGPSTRSPANRPAPPGRNPRLPPGLAAGPDRRAGRAAASACRSRRPLRPSPRANHRVAVGTCRRDRPRFGRSPRPRSAAVARRPRRSAARGGAPRAAADPRGRSAGRSAGRARSAGDARRRAAVKPPHPCPGCPVPKPGCPSRWRPGAGSAGAGRRAVPAAAAEPLASAEVGHRPAWRRANRRGSPTGRAEYRLA